MKQVSARHPAPATTAHGPAGEDPGPESDALVRLFEHPELPHRALPAKLEALYGGDLDVPDPCLYANFVSSIDGVVALGPQFPSSGSTISGRAAADRFVMGLLRACAHAVVVGAGALRSSTDRQRWVPENVYPDAADDFAELRRSRGLAAEPTLVVVTASGALPVDHPALRAAAVVATTAAGAARLNRLVPPTCTVLSLGDGPSVRAAALIDALHAHGLTTILTEAGPRLAGQFADEGLLDELFLTVSPVLAGRDHVERDGLLAGVELLPDRRETGGLLSARQQASYLFLRYRLRPGDAVPAG